MLSSLIASVSLSELVGRHLGREPLRCEIPAEALEWLSSLPELRDARAMAASAKGGSYCWRPDHWVPRRSPIRGAQALAEYDAGCSLYFTKVDAGVPALAEACRAAEHELGVPAGCVSVQGFASRAGYGVDLHFDHDENFNVQLTGRKSWRLGANHLVRNPLRGDFWGPSFFRERGLAADAPPPIPELETFETAPGSLVYVPRGFWHATRCLDDSIAIAFAVQPPYAYQVVLAAMQQRLLEDPHGRAFAVGVSRPGLPVNPQFREALEPLLARLADLAPGDCAALPAQQETPLPLLGARARRSATVADGVTAPGPFDPPQRCEIARTNGQPPLLIAARWSAIVRRLLAAGEVVIDERQAARLECSVAELHLIVTELAQAGAIDVVG